LKFVLVKLYFYWLFGLFLNSSSQLNHVESTPALSKYFLLQNISNTWSYFLLQNILLMLVLKKYIVLKFVLVKLYFYWLFGLFLNPPNQLNHIKITPVLSKYFFYYKNISNAWTFFLYKTNKFILTRSISRTNYLVREQKLVHSIYVPLKLKLIILSRVKKLYIYLNNVRKSLFLHTQMHCKLQQSWICKMN